MDIKNPALEVAIARHGLANLARRLGVGPQVLNNWRLRRVPAEYCPRIEREMDGEIRCEQLRSDVDWAYLRAAAEPLSAGELQGAGA